MVYSMGKYLKKIGILFFERFFKLNEAMNVPKHNSLSWVFL